MLIDKNSRTVFGKFNHFFRGEKKWTAPDREAIRAAKIIALDPFFGESSTQTAETIVKFAAATAASVCTRFPMALDPPSLEEALGLMKS